MVRVLIAAWYLSHLARESTASRSRRRTVAGTGSHLPEAIFFQKYL